MFNQNNLKKIKKTTEEFFQKMNFEVEVEIKQPQDSTIMIDLKAEEPKILIGERGQTLSEIQYILKLILRKEIIVEEPFYLNLDINNYKEKKNEYLKELARIMADEAVLSKKEKKLAPMSAYERRIIHLELASRQDVTTESIDQDSERKIVIKPSP